MLPHSIMATFRIYMSMSMSMSMSSLASFHVFIFVQKARTLCSLIVSDLETG